MVIYLDSLFLLNLGLDELLLFTAAKLGGVRRRHGRIFLAAVLGALYAAILFCQGQSYAAHPLVRAAVAVGMVLLAVGWREQPWRVLALFLLLSCALAGGVLLLERLGVGQMSTGQGVPATVSDGKLLLLCAAGEYLLVSLGARLPGHQSKRTVPVLLTCEGRRVFLRALVDTGNLLRDPLTGNPVLIAERQAAARLFPRHCAPTEQELCHPAACLEQLSQRWTPSRLRLVPYRAVGTERGLLLAVRVDEMEVDGVLHGSRLVAVTPGRLGDSYHGLIGTE